VCDKPPRTFWRRNGITTKLPQYLSKHFQWLKISHALGGCVMGVIAFPGARSRTIRSADLARFWQRGRKQRPRLKPQIERITAPLQELEGITGHSREVPSAMLARARAVVCKAELKLGLRYVVQPATPIREEEADPQPHVDREVLERLFQPRDRYQ
jgi:hypothetical protein